MGAVTALVGHFEHAPRLKPWLRPQPDRMESQAREPALVAEQTTDSGIELAVIQILVAHNDRP